MDLIGLDNGPMAKQLSPTYALTSVESLTCNYEINVGEMRIWGIFCHCLQTIALQIKSWKSNNSEYEYELPLPLALPILTDSYVLRTHACATFGPLDGVHSADGCANDCVCVRVATTVTVMNVQSNLTFSNWINDCLQLVFSREFTIK